MIRECILKVYIYTRAFAHKLFKRVVVYPATCIRYDSVYALFIYYYYYRHRIFMYIIFRRAGGASSRSLRDFENTKSFFLSPFPTCI